jgi:hypothetical protein
LLKDKRKTHHRPSPFLWGSRCLVFLTIVCLFVMFIVWPLYCLSFLELELWLLITHLTSSNFFHYCSFHIEYRTSRGRRVCIGFTTTYAISAYHHWCCGFESRSGRGVQQYVIKFVSDLWQVGGFLLFPPTIKLTATIYLTYSCKRR